MSFFNFRRGGANAAHPAAAATQTDSVEVMRRRAKHRLMGAAVLVLIGVVGFPLLFDTQPRPISVDIPIEIPGKNTVKPLVLPAPAAATAPVKAITSAEKVAADASLAPEEEILSSKPVTAPAAPAPAPAAVKNDVKPTVKAEAKAEPKAPVQVQVPAEAKPVPKTIPSPDSDGARARALLNATPLSAKAAGAEAEGRMVVQVGAFADAAKAREVRSKLERAGLKTYAQVADTKDGKRTRVRVGPFASRADAEKAAAKIKTLDLPAVVLTL